MAAVPSQVVVAAPPSTMVVAAPTYPVYNPAIVTSYSANSSLCLGIIQAVLGGIAFIVGCICVGQECSSVSFGYGIWSAILLIIIGSLGIAAKSKKRSLIIGYLIMSVIGLIESIGIGIWAAVVLVYDLGEDCWEEDDWYNHFEECFDRGSKGVIALDSIYLAVMILELILCIWSTVIASHICCAKPNMPPQQQYYVQGAPINTQNIITGPVGSNVMTMTPQLVPGQTPVMYNQQMMPGQAPMMYSQQQIMPAQPPAYQAAVPYMAAEGQTNPGFTPEAPPYNEKN